jgi:hypothetical protein
MNTIDDPVRGVTPELARAAIPMLDLILAGIGIDHTTERCTEVLRTRLAELVPEQRRLSVLDLRLEQIRALNQAPAAAAR